MVQTFFWRVRNHQASRMLEDMIGMTLIWLIRILDPLILHTVIGIWGRDWNGFDEHNSVKIIGCSCQISMGRHESLSVVFYVSFMIQAFLNWRVAGILQCVFGFLRLWCCINRSRPNVNITADQFLRDSKTAYSRDSSVENTALLHKRWSGTW